MKVNSANNFGEGAIFKFLEQRNENLLFVTWVLYLFKFKNMRIRFNN